MYSIYALVDPRDYITRYIGVSNDMQRRLFEHLNHKGKNRLKDAWIGELKAIGMIPMLRELEQSPDLKSAMGREKHWMKHYLQNGIRLFNVDVPREIKDDLAVVAYSSEPLLEYSEEQLGVGRSRTDDEIRILILYRLLTGHWPDELSSDMRSYYNIRYIKKDARYHKQAREWFRESKYFLKSVQQP